MSSEAVFYFGNREGSADMITLKTNYKDAVLDVEQNASRKFSRTDNSDGTISLTDVSEYSQEGDPWGSMDANNTNSAIVELRGVKTATISSTAWSSSAPYTQTVSVSGITSSDRPIIALYITGSPSAANVKNMGKSYGYIDRATTGNGTITFYCYNKKPTVNITVSIKGV